MHRFLLIGLLLALAPATALAGGPWFTDVTETSGIPPLKYGEGVNFRDLDGDGLPELFLPCVKGRDRLYKNLGGFRFADVTDARGIKEKGGIGAVFADFDSDGRTDLYIVRGAYPYGINILYRQGNDGTFIDISEGSGAAGRKNGISAVAGDFEGKGNLDLFVSNWGTNTFYKNSGSGRPLFTDATGASGLSEEGKSWGALISDFNCDGRPDIFVVRGGFGKPEDARLFVNTGNGSFRDTSKASGITGIGWSMGAVSADFNGDGFPDLFVTNYDGPDHLYLNDGNGQFTDITAVSGISSGHSIGASAGDIDGDLLPDLVVAGYSGPVRVYKNLGGGKFTEVKDSGLASSTKNEGVALADVDGKGSLDLYVASYDGHNRLYRNNLGGKNFIKVRPVVKGRPAVGAVARLYKSGGLGKRDSLLASQELQTTYGFCSQSPMELLFRLPDAGPYDIMVQFPGGAKNSRSAVNPGIIEISEE